MRLNIFLLVLVTTLFSSFSISQTLPPPPPKSIDTSTTNNNIFGKVEIEARFPGGDAKWRDYLVKNVNSSIPEQKFAPPGIYTAVVQFVVDKEGNISDVKPLTNHGFGIEEEVMRVIKSGPKWEPAIQNEKTVKAYRKQPVTFRVERDFTLSTYILQSGQENVIEVNAGNGKPEDTEIFVSNGTIKSLGGKSYSIKPTKPGKLFISVSVRVKKKMVDYGKIALEVK